MQLLLRQTHQPLGSPLRMLSMRALLLSGFLLLPLVSVGQVTVTEAAVPAPVQPMPSDRAEDSYAIYSKLLPLGETAGWPASYYDVTDTTITAVEPKSPCRIQRATTPIERAGSQGMNPHTAVSPPDKDKQDYEEILTDFDSHCHERLSLSSDSWKAKLPVHLLNQMEQDEFQASRNSSSATADKYKGSPALYAFSQVFFNAHHTVAMVYATHWCGGLCGQGFWIAFARQNGTWKQLQWGSVSWIS